MLKILSLKSLHCVQIVLRALNVTPIQDSSLHREGVNTWQLRQSSHHLS